MNELDRIKQRRRRRQEAFKALDEIQDSVNGLLHSLQVIAVRVQELSQRRFYFLLHPNPKCQLLADLSEHAAKATALAAITNRVEEIRAEFHSLRASDERELKELGAFTQPPTPTR